MAQEGADEQPDSRRKACVSVRTAQNKTPATSECSSLASEDLHSETYSPDGSRLNHLSQQMLQSFPQMPTSNTEALTYAYLKLLSEQSAASPLIPDSSTSSPLSQLLSGKPLPSGELPSSPHRCRRSHSAPEARTNSSSNDTAQPQPDFRRFLHYLFALKSQLQYQCQRTLSTYMYSRRLCVRDLIRQYWGGLPPPLSRKSSSESSISNSNPEASQESTRAASLQRVVSLAAHPSRSFTPSLRHYLLTGLSCLALILTYQTLCPTRRIASPALNSQHPPHPRHTTSSQPSTDKDPIPTQGEPATRAPVSAQCDAEPQIHSIPSALHGSILSSLPSPPQKIQPTYRVLQQIIMPDSSSSHLSCNPDESYSRPSDTKLSVASPRPRNERAGRGRGEKGRMNPLSLSLTAEELYQRGFVTEELTLSEIVQVRDMYHNSLVPAAYGLD